MNDYFLREQVKDLKRYQNISYREIAEYIEISPDSFYNWIKGYYSFSFYRSNRLQEVINNLKEK